MNAADHATGALLDSAAARWMAELEDYEDVREQAEDRLAAMPEAAVLDLIATALFRSDALHRRCAGWSDQELLEDDDLYEACVEQVMRDIDREYEA